MKIRARTLPLVALVCGAAAPAVGADLTPNLQPLAFLVGSCWSGDLPRQGGRDTHCFTPAFDGRFMRDRHVVTDGPRPYAGESLYRWDATTGVIRYAYYASDGGYSEGQARPSGDAITFSDDYVSATGERLTIRSVWTRDGADAYRVVAETRSGDDWRPMWSMRMVRSGPAT